MERAYCAEVTTSLRAPDGNWIMLGTSRYRVMQHELVEARRREEMLGGAFGMTLNPMQTYIPGASADVMVVVKLTAVPDREMSIEEAQRPAQA